MRSYRVKNLYQNSIPFLLVECTITFFSQNTTTSTYIDPNTQILVAKKFASGIFAFESENDIGSIFSKGGTEFYYGKKNWQS